MVNPVPLIKKIPFVLLCFTLFLSSSLNAMPSELYKGVVKYQLDRGDYFDALVLMNSEYKKKHQVNYARALQGFNLQHDVSEQLDKFYLNEKKKLKARDASIIPSDYFTVGRIEYQMGRCKPALRAFKKLKNKLSNQDKQEWAFYRANCFIRLGSDSRAMQVLNDTLEGAWASYAYYNLAISYDTKSRNKSRALKSFKLALLLNKGETDEEKELINQTNFAVGSLYLSADKPDLASNFFKKIYLDSAVAADALYFNGIAKLDSNDFRSAIQAWSSVKKYSLVDQSVAESYLAIPYAYERSGYIGQALEAYLDASNAFKKELSIIKKIDGLLKKHGAQKILIEEHNIEGLEWFLAKDVVTNTMKATYYRFFMQTPEIYDVVTLFSELSLLNESMQFWSSQLSVFDASLKKKQTNFKQKRKTFSTKKAQLKLNKLEKRIAAIKQNKSLTTRQANRLQIDDMLDSTALLKERVHTLTSKIASGKDRLRFQRKQNSKLKTNTKLSITQLKKLMAQLDMQVTQMIRDQLATFKEQMNSNLERSEQGLVHVFESIAESRKVKTNRLNGRYK